MKRQEHQEMLKSLMRIDQGQEELEVVYLRELLKTLSILDQKNKDLVSENRNIKDKISWMVARKREYQQCFTETYHRIQSKSREPMQQKKILPSYTVHINN